jgi:hypothetical protein
MGECETSGLTVMLRNAILHERKASAPRRTYNDRFFTDSEEAFQRDYKGNWHYYFQ